MNALFYAKNKTKLEREGKRREREGYIFDLRYIFSKKEKRIINYYLILLTTNYKSPYNKSDIVGVGVGGGITFLCIGITFLCIMGIQVP